MLSRKVSLPLVIGSIGQMSESAQATAGHNLLRDGPSDGVIVGDTEN